MYLIFVVIGIIVAFYLLLNINKGLNTNYVFRELLIFAFIIWYIVPISLSLFGYWELMDSIVNVSLDHYIEYACFEVWFYVVILVLFSLTKNIKINNRFYAADGKFINKAVIPIMLFFTLLMLAYNFLFRFNYNNVNDIENAEGGFFFIFNMFNIFIQAFLWIAVIKRYWPKFQWLFIAIILIYLLYYILSGSRIYLIGVIWLFYFIKRDQILINKIKYLVPIAFLTLGSLILLPILASIRVEEEAPEIESENVDVTKLILEHMNTKLNSIAYSAVLLEKDGVGFGGVEPYVGSVLKFFPRGLWSSKPTPTSYNGDISGTPSRRIPILLKGADDTYNVGVAPGMISLWHGYYSVILSIILNVFLLRILAGSLASKSILVNSMGFSLFYFPQLIMMPSSGDNIIQKLLEMLILVVILFGTSSIVLRRFNPIK